MQLRPLCMYDSTELYKAACVALHDADLSNTKEGLETSLGVAGGSRARSWLLAGMSDRSKGFLLGRSHGPCPACCNVDTHVPAAILGCFWEQRLSS